MTWVRIDDGAPLHPKILDAGPEAAWLWVAGLAHCNRATTEGVIRKAHLPALYPHAKWSAQRLATLSAALVGAGLWLDEGDFYRVHDYAEYQDEAMRDRKEARREAAKLRKRAQRERENAAKSTTSHAVTARDSHSVTERDASRDSARDAVGDSRQDTSHPPVPSRPVPTNESGGVPPRARPDASFISNLVSGVREAFESEKIAAPRQTRSLTWDGWHHIAAWCESQAALDGREPIEVAQALVGRFLGVEARKRRGYPLPYLAANPAEYWRAA